ncbi:MAG TPA: tRNA preQ1(34) S-adenosylmethionine ribosyltransferase-isomerase QueA [Candidatus Dormibacteraeota bacterium]|jgi:S-adenosylmethionine:tRNA ribosyltransferase-isomerase|nr:tRNA preQ1(34) S-adenosylmethionine ribosyltransferase-isomerase QueA [Candidatus Dormibacteraeota bacterium]
MTAGQLRSSLDAHRFDYDLPAERIAQTPLPRRDASRLMHLPPRGGVEDRAFTDLPELLRSGDLLVVNDTRVRAARIRGRRPEGGAAELLVLERLDNGGYACLVRPARRLRVGTVVTITPSLAATVGEPVDGHPGARAVTFTGAAGGDVDAALEAAGQVPLPPYIHSSLSDAGRYQTVYAASPPQSAAAPTAGLHFTDTVLHRLHAGGVEVTAVRLDVGLATFTPIRTAHIDDHVMHRERFELPVHAADAVRRTRQRGGRVVAAGTTTVRVLETCAQRDGLVAPRHGVTDLYLRPGSHFQVVDGLLTNFHQPRSSLLVLVAAFVGVERWREAYDHALSAGYRFLSFGDCMLCWRS